MKKFVDKNQYYYQQKYSAISIIIATIFFIILLLFFNSAYGNFSLPANNLALKSRVVETIKIAVAGWSIGLSNYCLQYITRNKFADAGVFGTYSFLQLATMVAVMLTGTTFLTFDEDYQMNLIYSAIGVLSGVFFYFISYKVKMQSKRILIYGVFLNTLVFSIISLILNVVNLTPDIVNRNYNIYLKKMLGFVSGTGSINGLIIQTVILCLSTIYIFFNRSKMIALLVNEDKSKTLNIDYKKFKFIILVIVGLVIAVTFSVVGYVAFFGLAINFIVNRFFKGINFQLIMSIFISILIMSICQLLAKISSYYLIVNNNALPLSAFFGAITFPMFIGALFMK